MGIIPVYRMNHTFFYSNEGMILLPSVFLGLGRKGGMNVTEQELKVEVIKHSAAIQIQNNITLLQRRTWNALLYNAYSKLPTEEEYHSHCKN